VVGGRGLAGRVGHHHGAMMPPVSVGTTGSRAQQSGHYGKAGVAGGSCCWAVPFGALHGAACCFVQVHVIRSALHVLGSCVLMCCCV
jgi:hypothetical protein